MLSLKNFSATIASFKDSLPSPTPPVTCVFHHLSPSLSFLPSSMYPSAPFNSRIFLFQPSIFSTFPSTPARPFLSHSGPSIPYNPLSFKSCPFIGGSRGAQGHWEQQPEAKKAHWKQAECFNHSGGLWRHQMTAWSLLYASLKIESTTSLELYTRAKGSLWVSCTNIGEDASVLILNMLLQLAHLPKILPL